MKIKRGSWRIVILVGPFAFKIAFIRIDFVFREIKSQLQLLISGIYKFKAFCNTLKGFLNDPLSIKDGARYYLFNGLIINCREFWYYLRFRKENMMPTYFSIGVVNIQRRGFPCKIDDRSLYDDLWKRLKSKLGADNVPITSTITHHFSDLSNFCYDQTRCLRMVDYGDPDTLFILLKYPDLFEPFYKSSTR